MVQSLRRPAAEHPAWRLTYAVTPPNRSTPLERRQAIAAAQSALARSLPVDALLVYDVQDETERNAAPRPFAFSPKVDSLDYALGLDLGDVPRVVYRAVAGDDAAALAGWLDRLQALGGSAVFVGAPSRQSAAKLSLRDAYAVSERHAPALPFGGVVIPERHRTSGTEHERLLSKAQQGCRFFVSQTVWSVAATKALLRDVRLRAERATPPPILLTFSPCGSAQTLHFQEWLGVEVPPAVQQDLLAAPDMFARSIELARDIYAELHAFASDLGLTVGCNVESVSSRATEVEASVELVKRMDGVGK